MSDIKDLDALVPAEKTVKLGGVTYSLPGDLPFEVYLRANHASDIEETEGEQAALNEMVSAMVDLFAYLYAGKPEESRVRGDVEKVLRSRGVRFNTQLLRNIYAEVDEDAPASDAADPQK